MTDKLTCYADVVQAVKAATNMVELWRVVEMAETCYMADSQVLKMSDAEWVEFNKVLAAKKVDLETVEVLTCACCHGSAKGRQWHNRDEGYGLCSKCAEWLKGVESPEVMRSNYGIAGFHYFETEA